MAAPEIVIRHLENSAKLAGKVERYSKASVTIGRSDKCDVRFDPQLDTVVSHEHAELFIEGNKLFLRDLRSRNGTYINNRCVSDQDRRGQSQPVEVHPSDEIAFGANGPTARASLEFAIAPPKGGEAKKAASSSSAESGVGMGTETMIGVIMDNMRPPQPPPRSISWLPLFFLMLLCLAGGAAFGMKVLSKVFQGDGPKPEEVKTATVSKLEPGDIGALGRLEPYDGLVDVAAPAGDILMTLHVKEGDEVMQNKPLATLWGNKLAEADLEVAQEAEKDATEQQKRNLAAGQALLLEAQKKAAATSPDFTKMQVEAQRNKNKSLETMYADTESKFKDASQYIPLIQSEYNAANTEYASSVNDNPRPPHLQYVPARAGLGQLRGALGQLQAALGQLQSARDRANLEWQGGIDELRILNQKLQIDRDIATAGTEKAVAEGNRMAIMVNPALYEKKIKSAQAALDRTIIKAPRDGTVLKIMVHEGEAVTGHPILQMGNTHKFQMMTEVFEDRIKDVKIGQSVSIESPAFPKNESADKYASYGALRGKVEKVLWTIKRGSVRDINPAAAEDLRVVNVQVVIDDADARKHRELLTHLIGLEATVKIKAVAEKDTSVAKQDSRTGRTVARTDSDE